LETKTEVAELLKLVRELRKESRLDNTQKFRPNKVRQLLKSLLRELSPRAWKEQNNAQEVREAYRKAKRVVHRQARQATVTKSNIVVEPLEEGSSPS
jgi:hypothetical protein